ncbi:MAG: hypothetical protein EHM63_08025, partial [Actinobacteria bacterium]
MKTNEILEWALDHQDYNGGSWNGMSGALAYRMGLSATPWPTVLDAINNIEIDSRNPRHAPVGAVHLFKVMPYGHLAIDVDGGGNRVLTTGTALDVVYGREIGVRHLSSMIANLP